MESRDVIKRAFDVAAAVVGLTLAWPLLALAAAGIALSSPGPVLFRARRSGRFGVPFAMLKLRTMHLRPADPGHRITAPRDPRVFAFGAFLRRTKLDELPQLINVLRGEMSIIGPRPEDPHFVEQAYTVAQKATLLVRPGLSSPGSLYHERVARSVLGTSDPEKAYVERLLPAKLALDLEYVRTWSFRLDLRLIGQTLRHILRRGSALTAALFVVAACDQRLLSPTPGWLHDPSETILVGAGDIGVCGDSADEATADLLGEIPGTVFTTGDNAYPSGTLQQFQECYGPGWGRHRDRTRPSPGNHDYQSAGAAPYFAYFGDQAGPAGTGYYSYALGSWHVAVLNSEIDISAASAQLAWLSADLIAADAECVVAYWHRPRFSSGIRHGSSETLRAAWEVLYAAGADVVLVGHEHLYERFSPQDPAGAFDPTYGIRQFVVGTGGADEYPFGAIAPNSVVRLSGTPGVLALRLGVGTYEWRFVGIPGTTAADSGVGQCHGAPPAPGSVP